MNRHSKYTYYIDTIEYVSLLEEDKELAREYADDGFYEEFFTEYYAIMLLDGASTGYSSLAWMENKYPWDKYE